MKRMTYFVMALALVLGLSQCKKEQPLEPTNEGNVVNITLNVGGNGGGSRHTINTENGDVGFEEDDVIYVGDGTTYIGTLTRTDGVFSGPINEPADGTEIYFYFVGGLTPSATPEAGTTSSFTVDISDQSTQMPVLSCNHVTYTTGTTSYSCVLQNQCALVKFTTASTTDPVHVGGLYTEAMIDFDNNSITNNDTTGFVALNSTSETEKWAVLLPQTGFEGAEAAIAHVGYTTTIPTIEADAFITGEDAVSISTQSNIVYLDWLTSNYTATDGQTLKGKLGTNVKISIAAGATTNGVTLDGVSINFDGAWTSGNYAGISCLGNATIILEGTNFVKGFNDLYPAIYVPQNYTLTIQGSGSLTASSEGRYAAGIGGGVRNKHCGNIIISGGTVTAIGGAGGAGIGGGKDSKCGNITISGGTVTATSIQYGAGIGCGQFQQSSYNADCGNILINGGTVIATGGEMAAGIGGGKGIDGSHKSNCGTIEITSGVTIVTATKGSGAPDSIGVGKDNLCAKVTIGGTEYAALRKIGQNYVYQYKNGGKDILQQSPLYYPWQ